MEGTKKIIEQSWEETNTDDPYDYTFTKRLELEAFNDTNDDDIDFKGVYNKYLLCFISDANKNDKYLQVVEVMYHDNCRVQYLKEVFTLTFRNGQHIKEIIEFSHDITYKNTIGLYKRNNVYYYDDKECDDYDFIYEMQKHITELIFEDNIYPELLNILNGEMKNGVYFIELDGIKFNKDLYFLN